MLKWLVRFLFYLAGLLGLIALLLWLTGYGYLFRGLRLSYFKGYTSANIYDGNDFDTRKIDNGEDVSTLPHSTIYNKYALPDSLKKMLNITRSTSFMLLKNDSIVSEYYFNGHADTVRSNSFSMAKTITTILVEMAIEDGKIPGWETKAKKYLPWLQGEYADELTLRELSNMTAGLNWDESYYNPFSITAEAYYGNELEKTMHRIKVVKKPGEKFVYQSGATELLGMCLKTATQKPVAVYASEKLWKPLGTEYSASWHLDHPDGMELTYCCFNAVTRDFARLGEMILHKGTWNNHHFIDSGFVNTMGTMVYDTAYGQSMWLGKSGSESWVMFQGTLGQYIIVIPQRNIVIVRTGNHSKKGKRRIPDCGHTYADEIEKWKIIR